MLNQGEPLVSVVMNCYNCAQFLQEAIDSVYAQTYSNWEILLWDNASIDGSAKIAKSYDHKIKYFISDTNTPLGEARNLVLKEATGVYIAFLDCDDRFYPGKLAEQVRMMQSGDFGLCYGSADFISSEGEIFYQKVVKQKHGQLFGSLLKHYDINMQTAMLKRSILAENNISFDVNQRFSPEYDLFMEVALNTKAVVSRSVLSQYRVHDSSLTHQSQHLIGKEGRETLARLDKKYQISQQFGSQLRYAKAVFDFQDAVFSLQSGDVQKAKKWMYFNRFFYAKSFIVSLLIMLGLSSQAILSMIGKKKKL
jgi:glycosyltransferase involved in cell wall biosynthesis